MQGQSKYRNAMGETKKENFYDVTITEITTEGAVMAVNSSFIAASWETNKGGVAIIDVSNPTRVSATIPLIRGHDGPVVDVKFSPFKCDLLATSSEDATVRLWQIPQEGIKTDLEAEIQNYKGHSKKVGFVAFHPCADNIIASASFDNSIHIWNATNAETISKILIGDFPNCLDWNYNGSLLGCSAKDKTIYVVDPRAATIAIKAKGHESSKTQKMVFVNEHSFASCGFSKNNMREVKLFDMRKATDSAIDAAVTTLDIDRQSGIMTPFYDSDLNLLYVPGRGEGNIHFFDCNEGGIRKCSEYKSSIPQKAITMFEKRTMNYNKCEIERFAKYTNNNTIELLSFYIPRRNAGYDPSLYPPCFTGEPSLSAEEWIKGGNKNQIVKEINSIESKWVTTEQTFEKKEEEVVKSSEEIIKELQNEVLKLNMKIDSLHHENEGLKKENNEFKSQLGIQIEEEFNDKTESAP